MKNKILVKVYAISLSEEFEIYIPVNESIKTIVNLVVKSISELSDGRISSGENYCLIDCETGLLYNYSLVVRDANIMNGKKMFLI